MVNEIDPSKQGFTSLHYAVSNQSIDILNALLPYVDIPKKIGESHLEDSEKHQELDMNEFMQDLKSS